ncbi:YggT family protein [Neomicrococcus aestuarii]|uniref:YggT family protein n=1 Tax=Neomicrococcus aestuarii TaxID=556325 RepID=A0A1L2ZL38_9MICC|nr:YggT family protein [Neomicrococcus aestuarii]APF39738.1 YggT family protein [Neomicrococcus aestuarii]MBB5513762.1 YggT family protein [Neomicrococcus aestuarii]
MSLLFGLLYAALTVIQVLLIIRIVLDVTQSFARSWRPKGVALMTAMAVYTVTDPPMRWIRSKVPTLDFGGIRLDLAFILLFFAVIILKFIVLQFG